MPVAAVTRVTSDVLISFQSLSVLSVLETGSPDVIRIRTVVWGYTRWNF